MPTQPSIAPQFSQLRNSSAHHSLPSHLPSHQTPPKNHPNLPSPAIKHLSQTKAGSLRVALPQLVLNHSLRALAQTQTSFCVHSRAEGLARSLNVILGGQFPQSPQVTGFEAQQAPRVVSQSQGTQPVPKLSCTSQLHHFSLITVCSFLTFIFTD